MPESSRPPRRRCSTPLVIYFCRIERERGGREREKKRKEKKRKEKKRKEKKRKKEKKEQKRKEKRESYFVCDFRPRPRESTPKKRSNTYPMKHCSHHCGALRLNSVNPLLP